MSEDQFEHDILGKAAMGRRSFIKKVILGTAFAIPVIASFDMLTSPLASGETCIASNGSSGASGSGTTGGAGGTRKPKGPQAPPADGACGGTPDGGTGGGSTSTFPDSATSDRAVKADIVPVAW